MIGALIFAYVKRLMMTYALISANIITFILTILFPEITPSLGCRPIYLSLEYFPQIYTLLTSMFIHGGLGHIFGNMLVFSSLGSHLSV